jgi:hypothetical protein
MKSKIDIHILKAKHRIELVMQEAGERFEADLKDPDHWHSLTTYGLVVDIRRQMWELQKPGMDIESGDVIAWLKRRYTWSFKMAMRYLQSRVPDPLQKKQPSKIEEKSKNIQEDKLIKEPLDDWQKKALQIGGERMRSYFSWSWYDLVMNTDETRIEPTHAPEITICPRCNKRIDWPEEKFIFSKADNFENKSFTHEHNGLIPVIAYSIKRRIKASELGLPEKEGLGRIISEAGVNEPLREKIRDAIIDSFEGIIDQMEALFVEDEDSVVCTKCAWDEYDFQIALQLCKTSAHRRRQAEFEEQEKARSRNQD